MRVLITYNVSVVSEGGQIQLRRIAKTCLDYGMRVQNSVFECELTPAEYVMLKNVLTNLFDPNEDSLRFYKLGKRGRQQVEHIGAKPVADLVNDALII
jgi:CRISPR-associated protein Cas2